MIKYSIPFIGIHSGICMCDDGFIIDKSGSKCYPCNNGFLENDICTCESDFSPIKNKTECIKCVGDRDHKIYLSNA